MDIREPIVGIICAGAPAPAVNSVISSATIQAINSKCRVLGFMDGFSYMMNGESKVKELFLQDVTRIYRAPGVLIRTSKKQPRSAMEIDNCLRVLSMCRVRYLITIGGTSTIYSARLLEDAARKRDMDINIVHVPKSIFNDLNVPGNSLGFETGRHSGVELVSSYVDDARAMCRWYLCTIIGQMGGNLALGVAVGSSVTRCIIPEEFGSKPPSVELLADMIESTIHKRKAADREYGVILIAEAVVNCMEETEIKKYFADKDDGHQRIAHVLADILLARLKKRGITRPISYANIGPSLRSCPPGTSDVILGRVLGYGACSALLDDKTGITVARKADRVVAVPFDSVNDSKEAARKVNLKGTEYSVAEAFMVRLTEEDLTKRRSLLKLANAANCTPEEFKTQFEHVAIDYHSSTVISATPVLSNQTSPVGGPLALDLRTDQ